MAALSTRPLAEMNEPESGAAVATKGGKKRLSVERIYQRKTQLEHVLLRPDSYVGSVEETTQPMWVWDEEKEAIVHRQITFVPGLYKIFDEILVNAADNKQRDHRMSALKITIDPENNVISVWNNGRGIPVEMHSVEKKYVPELIFGTLLTSSNYDDDEKKVTGGRNGYGAKLCNIFSTEFSVQTSCSESKKMFKQTWKDNMSTAGKVSITDSTQDFTKVTFKPDLAKFKMTHLSADMVALMTRRAYDMAGCTKGVSVYLNGKKLLIKTFKEYVELYLKGQEGAGEEEGPRKVVHEVVNPRWEVCVTPSDNGFQQASFVNSIATSKGGTHVQLIVDQLVPKVLEAAKKKNKGGMELRPFHIKGHLWVFVNCLVENPTFDSQTKENMTLKAKSFGSKGEVSDKFIKQVLSCGVMERVLSWARAKSQSQLNKKQHGSKNSKLRGIPKLDDANNAGGRSSFDCTLIVTEGDSAKALAVSGLSVVGRDNFGVFPLRGKLLNVREATHSQIMNNEEIKNMIRILGLQYGKKYSTTSELNTLRYGRIMVMADQDQDGSHIKGLIINFIHHNWPDLLRHGFIVEFITPIVKVTKGHQQRAFFSLPEFESWQATTENSHTWKVKYYKGLGTSTSKEAKEYFSDMDRHRIPFHYSGEEDDQAITLAFSKKCIDDRKVWLTNWLQHRRERREQGLQESFLYGQQQNSSISYSDFINKELILFSNMDNERSIPSVVDGLKPGQRKVMFTCFKRNDKREVKVAQLAGSVAEHSAYHHGEQSLMMTIINLAQNYIGSNNVNLLQPLGQFGTRLHGGKDAASPRYIFTMLSPLARRLFVPSDENLLVFQKEDNLRIEPEWYCPVIPTVLANGCEGIGTGYSTTVPNYNTREIVANIRRLMNGLEPTPMQPWYKGFTGTIAHTEPQRYLMYGNVARLNDTTIEITELPIRSWTQTFKENVLEPMLHGTEKVQPFITDYKEYHTDTTVKFLVSMTQAKMEEAEAVGFHKKFKLEGSLNTSNLVLFNKDGCLHKYTDELEILSEFYSVRLDMYHRRKQWIEGQLTAESDRLNSQARFIMEKIEGKIVIENKKKAEMVEQLKTRGYPSDPIKAWKQSFADQEEDEQEEDQLEESEAKGKGPDYSYLLSMQLLSLTREEKEKLLKNRDKKAEELRILKEKTPKMLWTEDIDAFMEELDRMEEEERQEEAAGAAIAVKRKKGKQGGGRQAKLTASGSLSTTNSMASTKPSAFAEAILPKIPAFCAEKPKKATRVKKDKVDPSQKKMDQFTAPAAKPEPSLEDEEEPVSLTERLKKKGIVSPLAQPTLPRRPVKRKATAAATAVIDIASSDSDGSDGHVSSSPPPPREPHQRRAAAAVVTQDEIPQYDDDELMSADSSDDDFRPAPKKGRTKPPPADSPKKTAPPPATAGSPPPAATSKPITGTKRPAAAAAGSKQKATKLSGAKKPSQKTVTKKEPSQKTVTKKAAAGLTKIPAVPKAGKKQTKNIMDFFPEDSNEEEEEEVTEVKKTAVLTKPKAGKKRTKDIVDYSEDSNEEEEEATVAKKPATKLAAAKKPATKPPVTVSSEDEEEVTVAKKTTAKKPAAKSTATKKPVTKPPVAVSSEDEEEEVTVAKKTTAKKPAAKSTAAKKPVTKPPVAVSSEDEEEAGPSTGAAVRGGGGRGRRAMKRVKYTFSDSEDESYRGDPSCSSGDELD